jgi:hypothetical protein
MHGEMQGRRRRCRGLWKTWWWGNLVSDGLHLHELRGTAWRGAVITFASQRRVLIHGTFPSRGQITCCFVG